MTGTKVASSCMLGAVVLALVAYFAGYHRGRRAATEEFQPKEREAQLSLILRHQQSRKAAVLKAINLRYGREAERGRVDEFLTDGVGRDVSTATLYFIVRPYLPPEFCILGNVKIEQMTAHAFINRFRGRRDRRMAISVDCNYDEKYLGYEAPKSASTFTVSIDALDLAYDPKDPKDGRRHGNGAYYVFQVVDGIIDAEKYTTGGWIE